MKIHLRRRLVRFSALSLAALIFGGAGVRVASATEIYDGSLGLWGYDPGQGGITPAYIYVDQNNGNILRITSWSGLSIETPVVTTSDFLIGGGLGVGGDLFVNTLTGSASSLLGVDTNGKLIRMPSVKMQIFEDGAHFSLGYAAAPVSSLLLNADGNVQITGNLSALAGFSTWGQATIGGSAVIGNGGFLTLNSLATTSNSAATYSAGAGTLMNAYGVSSTNSATNFLDLVANGTGTASGIIRFLTKPTDTTSTPVERLRIDGSGNIGIGTTSATAPFVIGSSNGSFGTAHTSGGGVSAIVAGSIAFSTNGPMFASTDGRFSFWDTNGSSGHSNWMISTPDHAIKFSSAGGTNNVLIGNYDSSGTFGLYNGGAERLRIDNSGNVGIGTTNPSPSQSSFKTIQIGSRMVLQNVINSQLSLAENAYYDGTWKYVAAGTAKAIRMTDDDGSANIRFYIAPSGSANGTISSWDTSQIKMAIIQNGNVGIGTKAPAQRLDVVGNVAASGTLLLSTSGAVTTLSSSATTTARTIVLPDASGTVLLASSNVIWSQIQNSGTVPTTLGGYGITNAQTLSSALSSVSSGSLPSLTLSAGQTLTVAGTITGSGALNLNTVASTNLTATTATIAGGSVTLQSATTTNSAANYSAAAGTALNVYTVTASGLSTQYLDLVANGTGTNAGTIRFLTKPTSATSTPTERMRVDATGNVGIGTATPANPLHLQAASNSLINILKLANESTATFGYGVGIGFSVENSTANRQGKGSLVYVNDGSGFNRGDFHFLQDSSGSTDGAPTLANSAMTIKNGGNVGIGTASPAEKLDVSGNVAASGALLLSTSGAATTLSSSATTTTRTIVLPDASGTLALTSDVPSGVTLLAANNTLTGTNTFTGNISAATIVASDIISSHAKIRVPASGDLSMGSFTESGTLGVP